MTRGKGHKIKTKSNRELFIQVGAWSTRYCLLKARILLSCFIYCSSAQGLKNTELKQAADRERHLRRGLYLTTDRQTAVVLHAFASVYRVHESQFRYTSTSNYGSRDGQAFYSVVRAISSFSRVGAMSDGDRRKSGAVVSSHDPFAGFVWYLLPPSPFSSQSVSN